MREGMRRCWTCLTKSTQNIEVAAMSAVSRRAGKPYQVPRRQTQGHGYDSMPLPLPNCRESRAANLNSRQSHFELFSGSPFSLKQTLTTRFRLILLFGAHSYDMNVPGQDSFGMSRARAQTKDPSPFLSLRPPEPHQRRPCVVHHRPTARDEKQTRARNLMKR